MTHVGVSGEHLGDAIFFQSVDCRACRAADRPNGEACQFCLSVFEFSSSSRKPPKYSTTIFGNHHPPGMPDLPHGWRLRNRDGEIAGPPLEEDGAYFSGDDSADDENRSVGINGLDIKPDSEGWDDVEDDTEEVSIKCLLCEENFTGAKIMIEHCKNAHDFDFIQVQAKHSMLTSG